MAFHTTRRNNQTRVEDRFPSHQHELPTNLPVRTHTSTSTRSGTPGSGGKLLKRRPGRDGGLMQEAKAAAAAANSAPRTHISGGSARSAYTTAEMNAMPYSSSSQSGRMGAPVARTPSLVSGSSASTNDSPRSTRSGVLKKKQSVIGKHTTRGRGAQDRVGAITPSSNGGYQDPFPEAVLGITMPSITNSDDRTYLDYDPYSSEHFGLQTSHILASEDLSAPLPPHPGLTMSPSTMYSDSPGPFSHSSTPTSISSPSPGAGVPSKLSSIMKHASPSKKRSARSNSEEDASQPDQGPASLPPLAVSGGREASKLRDATGPKSRLPTSSATGQSAPGTRRNSGQSVTSATQQSESSTQRPPELAHLADASPITSPNKARPARPSREGTSDITSLREPSPIIHSNLLGLSTSGSRRQSSEYGSSINLPSNTTSRTNLPMPTKSSRNPSPSPSGVSSTSSRLAFSRRPSADGPHDGETRKVKKAPPSTPSPSKFGSRFGFFRRTKTEPAELPSDKTARKGPAAGTGHEGYGKYGRRPRSGSATSVSGTTGKSTNADGNSSATITKSSGSRKSSFSSQGQSDVDDFFLERLAPKVIRGEGSMASEHSRSSEPEQNDASIEPAPGRLGLNSDCSQPQSSFAAKLDFEKNRPRLLPSAMSGPVGRASPLKHMHGSETTDSGRSTPSLAERRSFRRSKFSAEDMKPLKIPAKLNTSIPSAISSYDSSLADQSSVPDTASSMAEGKEGFWLRPKKKEQPKKQQKSDSKPSRKWNFFQSSQGSNKAKDGASKNLGADQATAPSRSVAHYAIVHPHTRIDPEEIEGIMKEAEQAADDSDYPGSSRPASTEQQFGISKEREPSMLLPPPPKFTAGLVPQSWSQKSMADVPPVHTNLEAQSSFPSDLEKNGADYPAATVPLTSLTSTSSEAPAKPSRLPQVGRIPKVVSNRNQTRSPPDQSFSRPFATVSPPTLQQASPFDEIPDNNVEPMSVHSPFGHAITTESAINSALNYVTSPPWPTLYDSAEFLAFSRRKDSEVSFSSSSGTSYNPVTAAVTATPNALPSEDEVWKEYDDLIDEVLSPSQSPSRNRSTVSDGQVRNDTQLVPAPLSGKAINKECPHGDLPLPPALALLEPPRLLSNFHSTGTLGTTGSVTNLIAGYGERNLSTIDIVFGDASTSSAKRDSGSTFRSSVATSIESEPDSHSTPPDAGSLRGKPVRNRYRDTMLMEMAEAQNDGLESMANLRFDALMTSKWLSFGRVLFSPAHLELKNAAEDRVLVLDGLGKDWSFYCALTYPGATVYNLGPNPSDSANEASNEGVFESLPNHRHVHHPHVSHPFPFPRGFFNAVVFRFPVASPEVAYRFTISECKRVLRPGGYLEISALDLDMMNMGNRARRAVRGLKVRMQDADPSVSLKSASDNIQKLLGRRGFENLNRCMVGVPVAGRVANSRDNSLNGHSASGSGQSINFGDLLGSSASQNSATGTQASDDEGITKMVAKVGRWWYSRCYETLVLPNGDISQSIWSDEALLRECENLQTNFRLLVCYAQKPTLTPRRTISV